MIAKIVVGVLGVAVLGMGGAFAYQQQTGCCPIAALFGHTGCSSQGEGCQGPAEGCKQSQAEPVSCCQQTTQHISEPNCCADLPVSVVKNGHETLLIEPREVK